ncbi:MAG: NINE protein [Spirochaetaceae bacterium]|jgi:TM2 domain-containing membrane protein YozV|nr:NINE protein [Spirochaetaceae bacterium]
MGKHHNCLWHQDRPAVGYCAFCGVSVCEECHKGAYCNRCIEEPPKQKSKALLFAVLLGWLGVHRYYMGFYVTGVIYTLSLGLFGIGWAIDIIRILFWSTVKEKKATNSVLGDLAWAIAKTASDSMSSDTKEWLFWRDKYGRPLLPFGQKSLTLGTQG